MVIDVVISFDNALSVIRDETETESGVIQNALVQVESRPFLS